MQFHVPAQSLELGFVITPVVNVKCFTDVVYVYRGTMLFNAACFSILPQ